MFTIGTGVGGGLVLNGRLYRGATGTASEVGHTVIGLDLTDGAPPHNGVFPQAGSLEVLASGRALDQLAEDAARADANSFLGKRLTRDGGVTGHDAVDGAREGDEASVRCLRILGERLGIGIANAITMFDPLEVVIGGGVSAAGELLLGPAREVAWKYAVPGAGLAVRDPARAPRAACRACSARRCSPPRSTRRRPAPRWRRRWRADEDRMRVRPCGVPAEGARARGRGRARARARSTSARTRPTRSTTRTSRARPRRRSATARPTRAVVVCGSGAGVAVAACKVPGIRAACAHDTYTAHQCVEHDDVNVLCLGARVIGPALAADVIRAFLGAQFTGEERHVRRLGKIQRDRARVHGRLMADGGRPRARRYLPIAEHGLVGDLHTVALVGTTGTIDWYCCPAFDCAERVRLRSSTPSEGGFYALRPAGRRLELAAALLPRHEHPHHALLHADGVGEVQDFMPIESVGHRHAPASADPPRGRGRARRDAVRDRGAAAVRLRARRARGRDAPARGAVPLARC